MARTPRVYPTIRSNPRVVVRRGIYRVKNVLTHCLGATTRIIYIHIVLTYLRLYKGVHTYYSCIRRIKCGSLRVPYRYRTGVHIFGRFLFRIKCVYRYYTRTYSDDEFAEDTITHVRVYT